MTIVMLRDVFRSEGFTHFNLSEYLPTLVDASAGLVDIELSRWTRIIKNSDHEDDYLYDDFANADQAHKRALEDYAQSKFSFSFRRLNDVPANTDLLAFQRIKLALSSEAMYDILYGITRRIPAEITQFYLNRFECGDFLYSHEDPGQSFGIAVSLTDNWDANHGGLTIIQSNDRKSIRASLVPTKYQVLIFDTSSRFIPHFVSQVSCHPPVSRIAAVVRYNAK